MTSHTEHLVQSQNSQKHSALPNLGFSVFASCQMCCSEKAIAVHFYFAKARETLHWRMVQTFGNTSLELQSLRSFTEI